VKEDLNAYLPAYTEAFPYHWDETLLLRAYSGKLLDQLHALAPRRMLSLGIGGQMVSRALIEAFGHTEYHLVEGSDEIIARYREEIRPPASVQIHHDYFENVQFPDDHFDAIEMGFVLEHVDDPRLILERFRASLTSGGLLFVAVPNGRSLHRLLGQSAGLMDDVYSLSAADRELGHKRYFDATTIAQLVGSCGYRIVHRYGLVLKPLTTSQLLSLALDSRIEQALIDVAYDLPDIANGTLLIAERA
jgi:SAM-dependent methyltransferase